MTKEEAIKYVKENLLDEKYRIEALETLIPELKQSEDERIKEAIIATIHLFYGEPLEDEAKEMITWLEKQREKKHSWDEDDNAYFEFTKAAIEDCYDGNNPLRKVLVSWLEKQGRKPQGKSALEIWRDMRLEVYQQASGNRHEPNYSDDSTKMFSLTDIDEIIEKISEQKPDDKAEPKDYNSIDPSFLQAH